ncbi:sigma 54-interacting transcriptional regulator [Paenibacillus sp. BSR1-1]|uniref:sigma 54-interacting transcriptional regulator n=1 Tax=Paenibacillus sp. BSR1-1 TaxID=3020845 RepID=UPI0025B1B935|nr:sigma-54-dependent Fis family transcriptional regulator [Paenibacillus sp. BSR1-1]MDN3016185.1 sigma 54-interacting transcriptional regulator [Paenibacillus sp. BSR1-1]
MEIRSIMATHFQPCFADTSLENASKIFSLYKINIIPIVNKDSILIGILTQNKIINAIARGYSLADSIEPLINFNPICISPDSQVLETREKLLKYKIGHAPVVNSKKEVVGIISTSQILFAYTRTLDLFQSQLQLLFDNLRFGVLSVDTNMRVTAINPLAREILRYEEGSNESFIHKNKVIRNMIEYMYVNREKPSKQKVKLNGYSFLVDCNPIFENKILIGVIIIIDNLTNIESLMEELQITKEWEEKLRTLVKLAYDAIALVDKYGVITMVNKGFCELLGANEKDLVGKSTITDFQDLAIKEVLEMRIPLQGVTKIINSKQCLISNLPIMNNGVLVGAISKITFRGLKQLHDALNKVSKLSDDKAFSQNNGTKYSIADIVGSSNKIKKAKKEAYSASQSRSTVLLVGESGTGKELFAHGIHTASSLSGSFIKVNCAAIPGELLESEFFGYTEGAFSGAKKGGKKGKFELAQNGTLFLDEIGDMPINLQSKLLRVLQEKEFEPVGGTKTISLKIRIIAATNKNLEEMIKKGTFREDLYYRLNILRINIPPLRERISDIPEITDAILERLNKSGFYIKGITDSAKNVFLKYNWPGNIRELQNILERAANLSTDGYIDIPDLPEYILEHQNSDIFNYSEKMIEEKTVINPKDFKENLNQKERALITEALKQANWNKSEASKILGISRTWLYSKMRKYNIAAE